MNNPFGEIYKNSIKPIQQRKVPKYPKAIDIELVNTCNFQCKMCPVGNRQLKRPKGFMQPRTYRKILQQISQWDPVPFVRFVRWGEPTLHKGLFTFIKEAKKIGAKVHLNTNGSKLDDNLIGAILRSGLDSIKISYQGYDFLEYQEYRKEDLFHILMHKGAMLKKARGCKDKPFIIIGTTVEHPMKVRTEYFKNIMKDSADEVYVGLTRDLNAIPEKPATGCREVFDKMSIDWDGFVTACCGDYDRMMVVGNIFKESLLDIWNGEKLNYYRDMLVNGRHSELDLCKHCIAEGIVYEE